MIKKNSHLVNLTYQFPWLMMWVVLNHAYNSSEISDNFKSRSS